MGKRGGTKRPSDMLIARQGGSRNPKSLLKLEHLQKLAVWASGEASIPSLGAFFGCQFAAAREALGEPPDPSLFLCQRCETILHPGYNCTVRIEKAQVKKRRRHKEPNNSTQNLVVYKCHFCSHRNQKRGTSKGHLKEICPPKSKLEPLKSMTPKSASLKKGTGDKDDILPLPATSSDNSMTYNPMTPSAGSGAATLLDAKRRKRNRSGSRKPGEPAGGSSAKIDAEGTVGASSGRKRRKSWTGLKEIVEGNERDKVRNISNLAIPFCL